MGSESAHKGDRRIIKHKFRCLSLCVVAWLPFGFIIYHLSVVNQEVPLPVGEHVNLERKHYMEQKKSIDEETCQMLGNEAEPKWDLANKYLLSPRDTHNKKKVAFYFLLYQELFSLQIWETFFESASSDQYSIWIHQSQNASQGSSSHPLARYGARVIPWIKNSWCAQMGVTVGGLHAMLQDPSNVQFIFLSYNTIPLKSFNYIYHDLVELSPSTSKFCLAKAADYVNALDHYKKTAFFWHGCCLRDYYHRYDSRVWKHHEWIVVSREHAAIILKRSTQSLQIYFNAWRQAAPDWALGEGCSDEAVPLLALVEDLEATGGSSQNYWQNLRRIGVEQKCLTFTQWKNCFTDTKFNKDSPLRDAQTLLMYGPKAIWLFFTNTDQQMKDNPLWTGFNGFPREYREFELQELETFTQEGFMFMRKVSNESQVITDKGPRPLEEVLPTLWGRVNSTKARNLVWSRLDIDGQPGKSSSSTEATPTHHPWQSRLVVFLICLGMCMVSVLTIARIR